MWRPLIVAAASTAAVVAVVAIPLMIRSTGQDSPPATPDVGTTSIASTAQPSLPATTTAPEITSVEPPPFTLPSRIGTADEGSHLGWRWGPASGTVETGSTPPPLVDGANCYGTGTPDVSGSATINFNRQTIGFTIGHKVTPGVWIIDEDETVRYIGNPFGDQAWLCSIATWDSVILAVGSGVFWSTDGLAWHGIEVLDPFAGSNVDGSNLMWVAAGPMGYIVLARSHEADRLAWFSDDLMLWEEIPVADGPDYTAWAWLGPVGASVDSWPIIAMQDGTWMGTHQSR